MKLRISIIFYLMTLFAISTFFGLPVFAKIDANSARGFLDAAVLPTGISDTDPYVITGRVITGALGLMGIAFFVIMVYAGFNWMLDRGNQDRVEKSKKMITAAIVGLVVVIAAYTVTYFMSQFVSGRGTGVELPTQAEGGALR